MAQSSTPDTEYFTVDEILACNDIEEIDVQVLQWPKKKLRIRSFTKGQQQAMRRQATSEDGVLDTDKLELLVFCRGVVNPKFDDIQFLNLRNKSAAAIDHVLRELFKLSGMTDDAAKSGGAALPV